MLPIYQGMTFPAIQEPSDPEDYSWEVALDEDQELRPIDEQHAAVYYTESDHVAFTITAGAAHDADGSAVPTSIGVSEGKILTLSVHHRSGDPATGGTPFAYPINPGRGWAKIGPVDVAVGPPDEQELREIHERLEKANPGSDASGVREGCVVPTLTGRSWRGAKRRLRNSRCKIGQGRNLKGASGRRGIVIRQNPKPGAMRSSGTTIDVTLG
jgi:hypothetical protein